jgi:transposase
MGKASVGLSGELKESPLTRHNCVKAVEAGKLNGAGTKVVTPEQMEMSRLRAALDYESNQT